MLLALLPFTAWAAPVDYSDYTVTLSSATQQYTGHEIALPNVTLVKPGDEPIVVEAGDDTFAFEWDVENPNDGVINAGTYTVTVSAPGGTENTMPATATATFTVTPVEIVYFLTGAQYSVGDTPDVTRHYSKTSGDFIGEDDLATYATFSFLDEDYAKFGVVNGKFSAIKTVNISSLKINWEPGVAHNYDFRFTSTANIVVTGKSIVDFVPGDLNPATFDYTGSKIEPGTVPALYPTALDKENGENALDPQFYEVTYGDDDHDNTTVAQGGVIVYTGRTPYEGSVKIEFDINKVDFPANAITPPSASELTYNGHAQELVEGASVTGNIGTFQYLVAEEAPAADAEGWSADIPTQLKAKDGIKVYWKVIGDANHNTPAFVNTQVVTAAVEKAPLVAQAAEKTVFYTGAAPELGATAIEYMGFVNDEDEDDVFPENDETYIAPTAAVAAEVVTAGFAAKVYDEGITVTGGNAENYRIIPIGNKLTINKALVKVTLTGGPDDAEFGSQDAAKYSWPVKPTWVTVQRQNGGTSAANATYADANVTDVLATTTTGTGTDAVTTLTGATLTREDHSTNAGDYALTLNNVAAKNTNYEIVTPYTYPTGNGAIKFTITPADGWAVVATNKAKVYGEADPTWTATYPAGLTAEEKAQFTFECVHTEDVGIYDIVVKGPATIRGNAIAKTKGVFAITKAPLTITIPNQTLYTGQKVSDLSIAGVEVKGEKTINGVKDNAKAGLTLDVVLPGEDDEISVNPETKVLGITDEDANSGSADDVIVIGQIAQAISNNYNITVVPGDLKVVNAALALLLDQNDATLDVKIKAAADACEAYEPEEEGDELTYNVFFNTFKMNKKEWYAMVLPFATTPAELVSAFGTYVVVNKLTGASLDESGTDKVVNVTFQLEWDQIAAGEPFLIKAADDVDWADIEFEKSISSDINDVDKVAAIFTGVYNGGKSVKWGYKTDGTTADADAKYRWLDHKDIKGTNNWKNPKTNAHALLPMEAFLILDKEATKARIFVEDIENGATAIKSISADEINGLNVKGMYNLNGMKMNNVPTQKGVYIINGKKVVIK